MKIIFTFFISILTANIVFAQKIEITDEMEKCKKSIAYSSALLASQDIEFTKLLSPPIEISILKAKKASKTEGGIYQYYMKNYLTNVHSGWIEINKNQSFFISVGVSNEFNDFIILKREKGIITEEEFYRFKNEEKKAVESNDNIYTEIVKTPNGNGLMFKELNRIDCLYLKKYDLTIFFPKNYEIKPQ
jgi:hypothetical protein